MDIRFDDVDDVVRQYVLQFDTWNRAVYEGWGWG
jgi:hypothetical protein